MLWRRFAQGLFSNASAVLIFVVLWSFSMSIVAMALLLSLFFVNAKTVCYRFLV
jgi:hypothetical protein